MSGPIQVDDHRVTSYPAAEQFTGPRPAVLVLPGGGYRTHTAHEGEGYARWLSSIGLHALVYAYPLPTAEAFPGPLAAARDMLAWLRDGDHRLDVDRERVGVIGSSAGGHLAALLATGTVLSIESLPAAPPRPDFAILAYAPADLRLLPDEPVAAILHGRMELRDELSPARRVDADACPTFIWATAQDPPGLPNALALTSAYVDAGVPVELHVYPQGGHGVGLADGEPHGGPFPVPDLPHTAGWTGACAAWLTDFGFLPPS